MTIIITYIFVIFVRGVLYDYVYLDRYYIIFNIDCSLYSEDVRSRTNIIYMCLFMSCAECRLY